MGIKYSPLIIQARLAAVNTDIGANAVIRIYSGSRPAGVGTAVSGQTVLATLAGDASAFGTVSSTALTANAIVGDTSADASGTATIACLDGDVGTSGADLNLTNTNIAVGQPVGISSFVITGQPV
jgi:hypothetical protein